MNILNLLTKEKYIVGVEINDLVIRVTYSRPRKRSSFKAYAGKTKIPKNELVLIEEPLPQNIISGGIIIDKETLGKIFKKIWGKEKLKKSYAIVSIPEDKIYSHIFSFPKSVNEAQLEQAVNLAINFQLPFNKNDIYYGWENTNTSNTSNEILISAIPKNIVDSYIEVFKKANINILVLESHLASISRSIKLNEGETTLITKKNQNSVTIFSLKDNALQSSRTLPILFVSEEKMLAGEVNKIKTSLESEHNETIKELSLSEAVLKDEYLAYPEIDTTTESKWFVSLGAFIRGEIPQGEDFQISLLPIGTVRAYEFQKTKSFVELIRNVIINISIFFLLTFIAAYLLIFSLSQIINNTKTNIKLSPVSPDITEKESLIKKVNSLTLLSQSFISKTVNWSVLIEEIKSRTVDGIIISNFSAPSINDKISIVGIATNRDILNKFKISLQESTYLSAVDLPITNLGQKLDIPFSISFRVKDPSMLNFK